MSSSPSQRSRPLVFLALLSLTAFAFAQSVYQAIVGNREFVVLNQITHPDLFLIILCFNVAPAAVLWLLWLLVRRGKPAVGDVFLSASFLFLFTPFLLELHKTYLSPRLRFSHNTVLVAIPLAIAAFVVFRYRAEFERFLLVLSPVAILFPAMFLAHAWHEVSPTAAPPAGAIANLAAEDTGQTHPPIFLLVLDEFTRPALLDSNGNIEAARFPHFAELAQRSTWFNNATANADSTVRSIPVIVTGNFPRGDNASDAAYPQNLFRLLAPEYDITIHEVVTRFCTGSEYHCPDADRARRLSHLLHNTFELYLWRVAPKGVVLRIQANDLQVQQQRFREFLAEIMPETDGRPILRFIHVELPHSPYMLAPDGTAHPSEPDSFDVKFAGQPALLERVRDRYERQIEAVDRQMGSFIDRLKQAGLYDRALIVVTADHGVSWKTASPGRTLTDASADMIFPVPLFIKLPGQTAPRVSSQDAQSIDLLPTIAAFAGVHVPWPVAGHNLFGPAGPPREKIMIDEHWRRFVYPGNFAATPPQP
jgi:hypothetical protein